MTVSPSSLQAPRQKHEIASHLRDFTVTKRVIPLSLFAVGIGFGSSLLAWALLQLIGLSTNLFYFHRFSTSFASPAANQFGYLAATIPVIGGLLVGLMARYGSDRIRGHGIPEAIESILMNRSKVSPKLAILKPVSAAIAIGSGGPFGAEGPIIMTGGAFGSLVAQLLHLTSAERKTLLVAGAAAGMSAIFAAPLSATLLALELLLFEFKPRSIIPVALASFTAAISRHFILGNGPIFPVPPHAPVFGVKAFAGCLLAGVAAGILAAALSKAIYFVEDLFSHLPVHWMWWPAIGGVAVGLGGLIFPPALGVGYDVIGDLLTRPVPLAMIAGVLFVKSAMWIVSLGSGTSGGVLAPLLMIGAAFGALIQLYVPEASPGFWPIVAMAAMIAGTLEAPFTAIIFSLELTQDFNMALPVAIGSFGAFAFMTVFMKRSIMTEKIARRGYHVTREYSTDPLDSLFVKDVMKAGHRSASSHEKTASIYPNNTLSTAVYRMAALGVTSLPVIERQDPAFIVGQLNIEDLLHARRRSLGEEQQRERVLRFRRGKKVKPPFEPAGVR